MTGQAQQQQNQQQQGLQTQQNIVDNGNGTYSIVQQTNDVSAGQQQAPATEEPNVSELQQQIATLQAQVAAGNAAGQQDTTEVEEPEGGQQQEPTEVEQLRSQLEELQAAQYEQKAYDITNGKENFETMTAWASDNLPPEQVEGFNAIINSGDVNAMSTAVNGLMAIYGQAVAQQQVADQNNQVVHGQNQAQADVFRSRLEMGRATTDARYQTDPAYRAEVDAKCQRSIASGSLVG